MIYNVQENTSTLTELLQTHTSKEMTSASTKTVLSLHTLPIHLVYHILDNLDDFTILVSCRGVCTRLNDITDTYKRYQVIFHFITSSYSHCLWNMLRFSAKYIILITFSVHDFKEIDFVWRYFILGCILGIEEVRKILLHSSKNFINFIVLYEV